MVTLLSDRNVVDYLTRHQLCHPTDAESIQIELKAAKNFNLLLTFPTGRQLLVKQECYNSQGKTAGEFLKEWQFQELLQHFPNLHSLRPTAPEVLHFDAENSIIVFNYLTDYQDVADFYIKEKAFPTDLAARIGTAIATIHRKTFNQSAYQNFLHSQNDASHPANPQWSNKLSRIEPEMFGWVPNDGLRFFALYQRYDSLGQAIAELGQSVQPNCLVHQDLKFNNILLHHDWEQSTEPSGIRLIDWERCAWSDPALDLGTLIASYLHLWLSSLVVSQSVAIEESLRLAMIPLNVLQPSIAALVTAYLSTFPGILHHRPGFLQHSVQFAGFALIQQIQAMIQYQKTFDNTGICMLQVAKSLLCRPEQSFPTLFGTVDPFVSRVVA